MQIVFESLQMEEAQIVAAEALSTGGNHDISGVSQGISPAGAAAAAVLSKQQKPPGEPKSHLLAQLPQQKEMLRKQLVHAETQKSTQKQKEQQAQKQTQHQQRQQQQELAQHMKEPTAKENFLVDTTKLSTQNKRELPAAKPDAAVIPAKAIEATATAKETSSAVSSPGKYAPGSKELPMPNENGIIIFYFHIPKTGGTTQMAPFAFHPDWKYRMVFGHSKQDRYREEMYELLSEWKAGSNTRVYYEYHAGMASPYMEQKKIREDLHKWRNMAKVQNVPFFALTVVRDPMSFSVSFFNFYFGGKKEDPRYYWRPQATEADFLELSLPNPQCLFCIKGETAYYKGYKEEGNSVVVPKDECEGVYDAFLEDFDWIGTTEALTEHTFPILEQIGQVRYCKEIRNTSIHKIKKSDLSESAVEKIRDLTKYDQSIYDQAVRDFPLSMWSNFDATPKPPNVNKNGVCHYKTGQALPPGELPEREGERRRFLDSHPEFKPMKHTKRYPDVVARFPEWKKGWSWKPTSSILS